MSLPRRFELAIGVFYKFDRLSVCDYRVRVELHAARNLSNIHLLKKAGSPYVRGIVGGAASFESRVVDKNLSPLWNECYELGCRLGERIELRVLDRDGGLLGGSNLGDLDLGLVDDALGQPPFESRENTLDGVCLLLGCPCLFQRARFSNNDRPRFLPLTSPTGGHGSDSATLSVRAKVFPRPTLTVALEEPRRGLSRKARHPAKAPTRTIGSNNKEDSGDSSNDDDKRAWEWDGVREWIVKARLSQSKDVHYDLAETWGLV